MQFEIFKYLINTRVKWAIINSLLNGKCSRVERQWVGSARITVAAGTVPMTGATPLQLVIHKGVD